MCDIVIFDHCAEDKEELRKSELSHKKFYMMKVSPRHYAKNDEVLTFGKP